MHLQMTSIALAIASALALLPSAPAHAQATQATVQQEGTAGTVFGRIREASRGVYLNGAVVTLNGNQVTTQRDGEFRITGVSPGRYQLTVDYLGYQQEIVEITVAADRGVRLDVVLRSTGTATTLDTVEVRATRDAQALALNQQRASVNYKNVVSADLIGRFPDTNVAEATQRIPGVSIERDQGEGRYVNVRGAPLEFTSVSVDGVQLAAPNPSQRAVELDTIPVDVIAALEVTKALTPDMDGDAIAGQINIVTQSALDRSGPTLRASLGAGRYELGPGKNQRASATFGNRFGADKHIGLLLSGSASRAGRFTDNVETEYFRADDGRILPEVTEIKDYEGERTRTGLTGRFDIRIDEDNSLYAILGHSRFRDEEYRNTLVIEYERHTDDSTEDLGIAGRATFDKELRERIQEQTIQSINLGGEHYVSDWKFDWQASRSIGELDLPARQQFIYRSSLRPRMRYDFSDPDFPVFTILNSDGSVLQEGINLPENLYRFRRYNQRFEDARESETGLRLDASRPQSWLGDSGDLKFGLRARLRDKRSNDDRNRNSVASDPAAPAYTDLLCPRVSNNFGRFEYGRVFCNDIFDRFGPQIRNANLLPLLEASLVNDYRASEDIHAGYVRLDAQWGDLTMVTGLRYERTSTSGEAVLFDLDTNAATPQTTSRDYGNLLPSLHFRYEFTPDSILRWSYSTGISRPNFTNTVPRIVVSEDDRSVEAGNPDLKATSSQNLDISYERYLRPLGLVSVAAFYKRLDDPIFVVNSEVVDGPFAGARLTTGANGSSGEILGIELAWQQTFDFLPSPLDGFGIYTNYTFADSSADLPFGIGSTQLPGTSRHNANVALAYEKYGLNARLSYNYRSDYIQEFDVADSDFDVFWDKRSTLDFSASYRLTPQFRLFAEINNLTDTKQRRFQGVPGRVLELEQFGRFWLAGIRYEM